MRGTLLNTRETPLSVDAFLAPLDAAEVKTSGETTRAWLTAENFLKWTTREGYEQLLWKDAAICGADLHPAIIPLHNDIRTADGRMLVFPRAAGTHLREGDAGDRFFRLPLATKLRLIQTVLDGMAAISVAGWVHRDFFDGNVMADFATETVALYDFELYVQGDGYRLTEFDRDYGSSRLMAPEQWRRGAWMDQRTNVYTLARFAIQYLSHRRDARWREAFQGSTGLAEVLAAATREEPGDRFQTVAAFVDAFRAAA
ncbi:serine/threonine protein kinase [Candidatus Poribacteria bacterium]|nr:serine/threonine protein kinase [Candidatus Poribacteria bacterium]